MGMRIKKDDMVEVIAGNEKGKRGKILRVNLDTGRATIENVNMVKRHMKPTQTSQGGIVEKEAGVSLSNIAMVCETCDKPVRVSIKQLDDGKRVRACKSCGEVFDK